MKPRIILSALLLIPFLSFAWGSRGHKMVADIAEKNLAPGVEKKVQAYLGATTFEQASVWMDSVRADHSYNYMSPWHYVDIESGGTYSENPKGDVVSELTLVIKELKNYRSMNPANVCKDLKILFHLCGDITQPLHTGYGSDKGGNTVKVTFNGEPTNLHHVWDSDIINGEDITTASCMAVMSKWTPDQVKAIKKVDVTQWMQDSRSYLPEVYKFGGNEITPAYIATNKVIIEGQICKGGLRLAEVLNEIFKSN